MGTGREVVHYEPEVEELAFALYIEADRNISLTHRLLVERCTAWGGDVAIPDRSTISRWAAKYDWPTKATELIAQEFPNIRRRQLARLVAINEIAIENHGRIQHHNFTNKLTGEKLSAPELQAINAGIAQSFLVNGMGPNMAGKEVPQPTPSVQVEAEGTLTVQERMRRQRERLEADRG